MAAKWSRKAVTAYPRQRQGEISLTTRGGQTTVGSRSEIVERHADGSLAIIFRLSRGRFLVGYALGEDGMLFRGELVAGCTDDEVRRKAQHIADYFAELDAQDEADTDWGDVE